MPPVLHRLLASPSTSRLLRSIVHAPELLAPCSTAVKRCSSTTKCRTYSSTRERAPEQKWRRWHDTQDETASIIRYFPQEEERQVLSTRKVPEDIATWAARLAAQERLKRLPGIRVVWRIYRHRGYRLPTDDTPDAEFLWGTFIKHPSIAGHAIDHAAEILGQTKHIYPRIYSLVMSYWLPREPQRALDLHHRMLVKLRLRRLPLRHLARLGQSTFNPLAYQAFLDIYRTSNERDLYDEVVLGSIKKADWSMARRWHTLCTFRTDLPSEVVAQHPVVQLFYAETSNISETDRDTRKYNQQLMRRLLGRDTAPVRFDDAFCARIFATRAIHPESIIQGLIMVGVNEIGPLAIRAMASRTQPIEDLSGIFEGLREAGIALRGCVFSLALEKFAMEQKWQLVQSMLDSDQHPDVFGHSEVQRGLLEHYLEQKDFSQAQRTLAILTLFHNDSSGESWNLLLQVYIKRSGPRHVMELIHDMRARDVVVSSESMSAIKSLLRDRRRGHKPGVSSRDKFDDLRFVTRIYMTILEFGMKPIAPHSWREIVRRYGMLGRFRELRRLLLWLLCWYVPRGDQHFASLPASPFLKPATERLRAAHPEQFRYLHFPDATPQNVDARHPVRKLFPPALLQGLIIWGFKAGLLPNAHLEQSMFGPPLHKKHYRHRLLRRLILQRLQWSIGLRTVVQLRDLGVLVHRHTVIKALQMQFVVLFGRRRSNKIQNRQMEDANTISYAHYVQEVNRIWGSLLFREPRLFGQSMLHQHMWHPRLRRQINRRASISLGEILGPDWQARMSEENAQARERLVEESDRGVLDGIQQHFKMQAKTMGLGLDPGFELPDQDANESVLHRDGADGKMEGDPLSGVISDDTQAQHGRSNT